MCNKCKQLIDLFDSHYIFNLDKNVYDIKNMVIQKSNLNYNITCDYSYSPSSEEYEKLIKANFKLINNA